MKTARLAVLGALALATFALAQRGGGGTETPAPPPAPRALPGDENPADLPGLYFRTSDYNGNGWISMPEAKASMNLDVAGFAVYDTDSDGRITLDEFTGRYNMIVSRGGAFAPPMDKLLSRRVPKRTPEELIAAFDSDKDGNLEKRDVQRALAEYGAQGVDAEKVLATVDADQSGRIEATEAQALLDVLVPPTISVIRRKASSVSALFDQPVKFRRSLEPTPYPERLRGPLPTFRRLDFDRSGDIGADDLEALQRPLQIPIRASAVIATLDLDGDGVLSREEFAASMQ